jgi:hypothetical protein
MQARKQQARREQLTMQRKQALRSAYVLVFEDEALGVQVFRCELGDGALALAGFRGTRAKPDFRYRFGSQQHADKYRQDWYDGLVKRATEKAARKAAAEQAGCPLAVGDVLVSSWGYDQTNYDYYQVTRLVGRKSVEIRQIAASSEETESMRGQCVPLKGHFVGDAMVRRVTESGGVKVRNWGVWAHKKESQKVAGCFELFKPDSFTSYA